MLLPALVNPPDAEAIRVGDRALTYPQLAGACAAVAARVGGLERVAVWATPSLETCVATLGALVAGVAAVPVNPRSGERELAHMLADSAPGAILCAPGDEPALDLARLEVDVAARDERPLAPEPAPDAPAFVMYTSGTTGPPKGAVLSRRALAANLDALAGVWDWTAADRLVHGLPLFHVHGLVLGVFGPIRRAAALEHVGRFSVEAVVDALVRGATMLFGVPTMYGRLLAAAERSAQVATALRGARLLASGSAGLPAAVHERVAAVCGQRIFERYGLTETLIVTAARGPGRRPGYVGPPLPGVELRLLDERGAPIEAADDETMGEVIVSGESLFSGYLNRASPLRDGWLATGDLAVRAPDGALRIVGRRATDLIKSGGYKIGAGEVEAALVEHPAVAEAAVTAAPDPDLGERVVAWVVAAGRAPVVAEQLADHVARLLAPHKRPREVHVVAALPRNELGKVQKHRLVAWPPTRSSPAPARPPA